MCIFVPGVYVIKIITTDFDVKFNGNISQLLFFRDRKWVCFNLINSVCGQVVNTCNSASHRGPLISSTHKKSTVKSIKSCFWRNLNIVMPHFGLLPSAVKCRLFNQYCYYFKGSPLRSVNSTVLESMCVSDHCVVLTLKHL